jgi:hypothetical protein
MNNNGLIFNWIELNWIQVQLKSNGIQIGGKDSEILLMNMVLEFFFN